MQNESIEPNLWLGEPEGESSCVISSTALGTARVRLAQNKRQNKNEAIAIKLRWLLH